MCGKEKKVCLRLKGVCLSGNSSQTVVENILFLILHKNLRLPPFNLPMKFIPMLVFLLKSNNLQLAVNARNIRGSQKNHLLGTVNI